MKKILSMIGMGWASLQLTAFQVEARTVPVFSKPEVTGRIAAFLKEYNILLNGMWGFLMLSSCLIFVVHLTKLGKYSDNPFVRQKIMGDLMITGVCTALLGSFGLFFFLIQRMFL